METNHFILVLVSISCLFSFSASTAPSPTFNTLQTDVGKSISILPGNYHPGLQNICGGTDNPVECLQTISPLLTEKTAIDPVSILRVGIEATNQKTKEAMDKANSLLKDPSTDKEHAQILDLCVRNFDNILDNDNNAITGINEHDLFDVKIELEADSSTIRTCEDEFEESKIESPVREMAALVHKTISNNLAIAAVQVHF